MKTFHVSVAIRGFAGVKVEAKNKEEARQKALAAHFSELEVEQYTIQADLVEKVEEVK